MRRVGRRGGGAQREVRKGGVRGGGSGGEVELSQGQEAHVPLQRRGGAEEERGRRGRRGGEKEIRGDKEMRSNHLTCKLTNY